MLFRSLQEASGRLGPTHAEKKICDKLVELYHREELMWRHRSRVQWLSEGDRNTRFFHLRATQRKKKNMITHLTRDDGSKTECHDEMSSMARGFLAAVHIGGDKWP